MALNIHGINRYAYSYICLKSSYNYTTLKASFEAINRFFVSSQSLGHFYLHVYNIIIVNSHILNYTRHNFRYLLIKDYKPLAHLLKHKSSSKIGHI